MDIGDRIRRERRLRHLTQAQLAQRIGVDKSAVGQWESRKSRTGITTANLIAVADALAIPVSRLTGEEEAEIVSAQTDDERQLLKLYRLMSPDQQDIHLRLFHTSVGLAQPPQGQSDPLKSKRISR